MRDHFHRDIVLPGDLLKFLLVRSKVRTDQQQVIVLDAENKGTEMGRKHIIPYALYRAEGYVSANLARKTTGFSEEDLQLLWQAILNMFENDHSAARGKMAVRELIVFKHASELGNAPAYKLFDAVQVQRKAGVIAPRSYHDYTVSVSEDLPEGITCERMS